MLLNVLPIEIISVVGLFLLPFIFIIFFIWTKSKENRKRMELRAELYIKSLEKGEKFPEKLFETPKKKNNSLKTGIILIAAAFGIALFAFLMSDTPGQAKLAYLGIIPLFLGLGFLIIHFIEKKDGLDNEE